MKRDKKLCEEEEQEREKADKEKCSKSKNQSVHNATISKNKYLILKSNNSMLIEVIEP